MGPAPFCAMHISVMMLGNSMCSRAPYCPSFSRSTGTQELDVIIFLFFLGLVLLRPIKSLQYILNELFTCYLWACFARGSFAAALLCTYNTYIMRYQYAFNTQLEKMLCLHFVSLTVEGQDARCYVFYFLIN